MKYLIIGSEGSLGSALAERLRKNEGSSVIGIDICNNCGSACSKYYSADIKHTERIIDICNKEKPDIIYNLAAVFNSDSKEIMFEINCFSPVRLAEKLSGQKVKLVLIGSAAEYGIIKTRGLIAEEFPLKPVSDYGISKACQTLFALRISRKNKYPAIIIARLFNLVGPGISNDLFIGAIAKQIARIESKNQEPLVKVGNIDAYRDYLSVDNAAEYLSILAIKGKSGEVYNICSGKAMKIVKILKDLIAECRVRVKIQKTVSTKQSDPGYVVGDNRKISKLLKLKSTAKDWKELIKMTVDWYRRSI
jgi:GDP-4-dehydro-6-deoxy-D-mannose reductase